MKNTGYITIVGWMVNELNLSGNELLCYALINGFSQDDESEFTGSLKYISDSLNMSKDGARRVLNKLVEKGLVAKREESISGVKFCRYSANRTIDENRMVYENFDGGIRNFRTGGIRNFRTNNTNIDNTINNNKPDNQVIEPSDQEKKEIKTLFRNSEIYKKVKIDEFGREDYSDFVNLFPGDEFKTIDLIYYYHCVADWSDQANKKRTARGWIATVRNFIRSDIEKGKLKKKPEFQDPQKSFDYAGAMDYLNENFE